jgi:hypothetical protein
MALGTKLLVILISISIALTLSGYNAGVNNADDMTGAFGFEYHYNINNSSYDSLGTENIDRSVEGINVQTNQTGIVSGVTNFFDRYENVQGWLGKVFSFFTAPIGVLQGIEGTPPALIMMVGIIWVILWGIAIASFIWRTPF